MQSNQDNYEITKDSIKVVTLSTSYSGEYFFKEIDGDRPKSLTITKLLGGKENVKISKWWTHHGGGGWVTEWRIVNLKMAISSANKYGFDVKIIEYIK